MQIFFFLEYKMCLHAAEAAQAVGFFIVILQQTHLRRTTSPGNNNLIVFCFKPENTFHNPRVVLEKYITEILARN